MIKFKDFKQSEVVAEIVKHYPEKLEYGVWWEKQGSPKGQGCRILKAEDITPAS
jgi:hypothetical protein